FEWFGGVPEEVLVDNQKAAVLEHPRGGPARFHPRFVDLAGHYPKNGSQRVMSAQFLRATRSDGPLLRA
ncbi:MAG: hypothetical protein P0121_13810, partial [Nitrospira sp.]|nr:hypothetical protein [Nitrospira sp.]